MSLPALKTEWLAALSDADDFIRRQPPGEVGCLYRQELPTQGAHNYDVSEDGQRFLMLAPVATDEPEEQAQIVIVENWLEELKRLIPTN